MKLVKLSVVVDFTVRHISNLKYSKKWIKVQKAIKFIIAISYLCGKLGIRKVNMKFEGNETSDFKEIDNETSEICSSSGRYDQTYAERK